MFSDRSQSQLKRVSQEDTWLCDLGKMSHLLCDSISSSTQWGWQWSQRPQVIVGSTGVVRAKWSAPPFVHTHSDKWLYSYYYYPQNSLPWKSRNVLTMGINTFTDIRNCKQMLYVRCIFFLGMISLTYVSFSRDLGLKDVKNHS